MRLGIVTHYFPPHVGGIETVAMEQARRLAERGWTVDVYTSRLGEPRLTVFDRVTVHRYRALNVLERGLRVPVPVPSPLMLSDLRRAQHDVVMAHGHTYISSLYAAIASSRGGAPFVLVQHSPWIGSYPRPLLAVQRAADRTIGRLIIRRSAAVVAVSEHTATYVRSIESASSPIVVYSGVDTDRFRPTAPRVCPSRPMVVTLRRLVPRQGVDGLIRAWMAHQLGDHADLVVGGSGPELEALSLLAASDPTISFAGRIAHESLASFYRDADLVVVPTSAGEGFGLVAAEAMASGRPVIATASGGLTELVRQDVDGLLVPVGDSDALGRALHSLIVNHGRRCEMARNAASRDLGWERSIDTLHELLSSQRR